MKRIKLFVKLPRSHLLISSKFPSFSLSIHEKTQFSPCRNFSNNLIRFSDFTLNNSNQENKVNQEEKTRKRIKELNEILELNPDFTDAMIERSKCLAQLSDWKSACIDLEKIVAMDQPNDLLIVLLEDLYWYYTREGNYDLKRATEHFERLFQIVAKDSIQIPYFYYNGLYSLYFDLKLYEKAITIATEAIKSIESNGPVEMGTEEADNLARFLRRRGNLLITKYKMMDRGRKDLDRAYLLSSSKYHTLVLMFDSFEKSNEHELMLKTYEMVKECEKNETRTDEKTLKEYITLHRFMKDYFLKRNENRNALECLQQYYTANTETLNENYSLYQYLCMIVGDYLAFIESTSIYLKVFGDITKDIESNPPPESAQGSLQHTLALSTTYWFVDRFDDSLRECEKLKQLLETTSQTTFPKEHLLGFYYIISTYSYMKKGNESLTKEFAMQAKKFFPIILQDIAQYNYEIGNYPTARYYCMESYNESKDLRDLSNLVDTFIIEKDYESAIRESEKILEIAPNHYLTLFNLGEVYFQLQDLEKARNSFDRAIAEANGSEEENRLVETLKGIWPQYFEKTK